MEDEIKKLLEHCRHEFTVSQGLTIKNKSGVEWELDHKEIINKIDKALEVK